jgi:hypothetical protein
MSVNLWLGSFKPRKRVIMARKGMQGNRTKGKKNEASSSQGPVNRTRAVVMNTNIHINKI